MLGEELHHRLTPVLQEGEGAGLHHQWPEPLDGISAFALQERIREVIGQVGLRAAPVEQPAMEQAPEKRSPKLARGAFFQEIGIREHRQATAVGDDMELIQAILCFTKSQPCEELLQSCVTPPDGKKDQVALVIANAGVDIQVWTLLDLEELDWVGHRYLQCNRRGARLEGREAPRGVVVSVNELRTQNGGRGFFKGFPLPVAVLELALIEAIHLEQSAGLGVVGRPVEVPITVEACALVIV